MDLIPTQNDMTELLKGAIAKLRMLPAREQDAIASIILEELEGERYWHQAFSRSPDALGKLAAIAMVEHNAGKTEELDPETL